MYLPKIGNSLNKLKQWLWMRLPRESKTVGDKNMLERALRYIPVS